MTTLNFCDLVGFATAACLSRHFCDYRQVPVGRERCKERLGVKRLKVTIAKHLLLAFALGATPVTAENFTTAAEVKPIVGAIRAQWIAVRLWEGHDLLYFTNLLSWRCGLSEISYAVNGQAPRVLQTEPCYEGEAAPNALKVADILPYVSFPPNTIQSIEVAVTYEDGTSDTATFERAAVQID